MNQPASELTFAALRDAAFQRLPDFKNNTGDNAHSEPDGSDWSISDWTVATVGELGEFANLVKKLNRNDFTLEEARSKMADELADVASYLVILAERCGISLENAIIKKFNEVSDRVGSSVKIGTDMPFGIDGFFLFFVDDTDYVMARDDTEALFTLAGHMGCSPDDFADAEVAIMTYDQMNNAMYRHENGSEEAFIAVFRREVKQTPTPHFFASTEF